MRREKKAKRSVLIADAIADKTITIGGILVIIVVLGIPAFLVMETLPLFKGGTVTARHEYSLNRSPVNVLNTTMDDYKTVALTFSKAGKAHLFHAKTGVQLTQYPIDFQGKEVTAFAATMDHNNLAFGFSAEQLPRHLQVLDDRDSTDGSAVYSKIPGDRFRKISVQLEFEHAMKIYETGASMKALDYRLSGEAERKRRAFAAVDREGLITLNMLESKINLLTGEMRTKVKKTRFPPLPPGADVHKVLLFFSIRASGEKALSRQKETAPFVS